MVFIWGRHRFSSLRILDLGYNWNALHFLGKPCQKTGSKKSSQWVKQCSWWWEIVPGLTPSWKAMAIPTSHRCRDLWQQVTWMDMPHYTESSSKQSGPQKSKGPFLVDWVECLSIHSTFTKHLFHEHCVPTSEGWQILPERNQTGFISPGQAPLTAVPLLRTPSFCAVHASLPIIFPIAFWSFYQPCALESSMKFYFALCKDVLPWVQSLQAEKEHQYVSHSTEIKPL